MNRKEKREQINFFARLAALSEQFPDLRIGQLISNVARDPSLYYVEDADLIAALEAYYGGLVK